MDDAPDRGESRAPHVQDLISLCQALNRESARYLLIGGFAVILHGFVRSTKDVDFLVDPSEENIRAVKRALGTLPPASLRLALDDQDRGRAGPAAAGWPPKRPRRRRRG